MFSGNSFSPTKMSYLPACDEFLQRQRMSDEFQKLTRVGIFQGVSRLCNIGIKSLDRE